MDNTMRSRLHAGHLRLPVVACAVRIPVRSRDMALHLPVVPDRLRAPATVTTQAREAEGLLAMLTKVMTAVVRAPMTKPG